MISDIIYCWHFFLGKLKIPNSERDTWSCVSGNRDLLIQQKGPCPSVVSFMLSDGKTTSACTWHLLWTQLWRSELTHRLTVLSQLMSSTGPTWSINHLHTNIERYFHLRKKKMLICWEWVEKANSTLMSLNMKLQSRRRFSSEQKPDIS